MTFSGLPLCCFVLCRRKSCQIPLTSTNWMPRNTLKPVMEVTSHQGQRFHQQTKRPFSFKTSEHRSHSTDVSISLKVSGSSNFIEAQTSLNTRRVGEDRLQGSLAVLQQKECLISLPDVDWCEYSVYTDDGKGAQLGGHSHILPAPTTSRQCLDWCNSSSTSLSGLNFHAALVHLAPHHTACSVGNVPVLLTHFPDSVTG